MKEQVQGEKGETWEGGVQVPALAWWPGVIAPNQDPLDIVHPNVIYALPCCLCNYRVQITDWYTTFASSE